MNKTIKTEVSKKGGTEWLKQVNDIMNNTTMSALNNTTLNESAFFNETLNTTRSKTSPTMLTVNTSNMFLNDHDSKKRKVKYVKNGYAEKLQKLLIRQTSSINFIKHHMNKKNSSHLTQTQYFKNSSNIIKAIPFYKQSLYNSNFCLIHAINVDNLRRENDCDVYITVLMDSQAIDPTLFCDLDTHLILNIYPPWKKIYLSEHNQSVYFNVNLIELENNEFLKDKFRFSPTFSFNFTQLKCPQCLSVNKQSQNSSCDLNLFSFKLFLDSIRNAIKATNAKHLSPSKHNFLLSQSQYSNGTQSMSKNILQSNNSNQLLLSSYNTQYMNVNSILDALENVGYYGLVSFKATVQSIGLIKWSNNSCQSSSFYQATQKSQATQNFQFKHVIIVSDKCGMFALIVFPFSSDFTNIFESYKYQFNSLKFLEKQVLSQK